MERRELFSIKEIFERISEYINEEVTFTIITDKEIKAFDFYVDKDYSPLYLYQRFKKKINGKIIFIHLILPDYGDIYYVNRNKKYKKIIEEYTGIYKINKDYIIFFE